MKGCAGLFHLARLRGVAQACARGLFPAALCAATLARAAYVGTTRLDEGSGGQDQIAVFSLASIAKAAQGLADSFAGIGAEGAADTAAGILSWLVMLPSLDCADLTRPATVFLITPPEGQEMPDQVAVIPLSPVNGERRLRESLAAAYESVSGKTVVHCSRPRDDNPLPVLSLIVTRETAYVASSRESLKWIARHWRDGTIPTLPDVREGATISAFLDASLAAKVLDMLLAGADGAGDTASAVRFLLSFRDLLRPLDSLHASLSADIHAWRLAVRLSPATGASPLPDAGVLSRAPLAAIPRDAYCVADGALAPLATLLPTSFTSRYGGESAYSFFVGPRLLPGLNAPDAEAALAPFLTGESAAGFSISKGEPPARIQAFALSDPVGAAAALRTLLPWGTEGKFAIFRLPREEDGRIFYGYIAKRQASAETAEDYAASALILLAQLHCVELAIDGDRLLVVSGPRGILEKLLTLPPAFRRHRALDELARVLPPLPEGETLVGVGELAPTQTFSSIIANLPGLGEILRQLPRHGAGLAWRISRKDNDIFFETSLSTSELFALSILRRIDQRQIGGILLDHILGNQGKAQ